MVAEQHEMFCRRLSSWTTCCDCSRDVLVLWRNPVIDGWIYNRCGGCAIGVYMADVLYEPIAGLALPFFICWCDNLRVQFRKRGLTHPFRQHCYIFCLIYASHGLPGCTRNTVARTSNVFEYISSLRCQHAAITCMNDCMPPLVEPIRDHIVQMILANLPAGEQAPPEQQHI